MINIESWNWCHENEDMLDFDVSNWPSPVKGRSFTLRLESMIHGGMEGKIRSRKRNIIRLKKAQGRQDIVNMSIHYSCCIDILQLEAIVCLVKHDVRDWESFAMTGINETGNFYSPRAFSEELQFLFQALRHIRILKLQSSPLNRGHGLELLLEKIPSLTRLEELRLEGWQIDRISSSTLIKSLHCHTEKSIRILSLRSCRFLGENSFYVFCRGLKNASQLKALGVSYCNLDDNDIIPLIGSIKTHPGIECVNLEKNCCRTQSSVDAIAKWISEGDCKLRALNVGALWTEFSQEGLLQRVVDPTPLFFALSHNSSLCDFNVSENYLENEEIRHLTESLVSRHKSSNLCSLDVGVNPFDENGASSLLQLVRDLETVKNIKFENAYMNYKCAQLIKIQAEVNYFDAFIGKSLDFPLSLWPDVFDRIQQGTNVRKPKQRSKLSTDHIYRLLRARTGSYGKQLSLRIAMNNTKSEHWA